MDFDQFQALSRRTQPPAEHLLGHSALGIAGEAGEVVDVVKKHTYQGHELDVPKLVDEMGDILWHLCEMCDAIGVPFSAVASRNVAKLQERYPDGFDPERSRNRK
ncbi:MAG TPA: nucleoside triphosphate pyrophosphohydrolase family protein [Pseudomonadales bacterium]|nr:nucleoside triphosphate pyrophosphohydrolase family protein [Pseudomonadales bacterium]